MRSAGPSPTVGPVLHLSRPSRYVSTVSAVARLCCSTVAVRVEPERLAASATARRAPVDHHPGASQDPL